jgi:hypothetical protein
MAATSAGLCGLFSFACLSGFKKIGEGLEKKKWSVAIG